MKLKIKKKKIDILINNAGIYGPIDKFEKTVKDWLKAFNINFHGEICIEK